MKESDFGDCTGRAPNTDRRNCTDRTDCRDRRNQTNPTERTEEKTRIQTASQCAPVIAGIKVSNLLILDEVSPLTIMKLLDGTGLSFTYLYSGCSRKVWLVYWLEGMEEILSKSENQSFLRLLGYKDFDCGAVLAHLKERYQAYLCLGEVYPHELGLLLGYPLADVQGFMKNRGKNYLYSGYWKVYSNAEDAKRTFARYTQVRQEAVRFVREGKGFWEMTGGFSRQCAV